MLIAVEVYYSPTSIMPHFVLWTILLLDWEKWGLRVEHVLCVLCYTTVVYYIVYVCTSIHKTPHSGKTSWHCQSRFTHNVMYTCRNRKSSVDVIPQQPPDFKGEPLWQCFPWNLVNPRVSSSKSQSMTLPLWESTNTWKIVLCCAREPIMLKELTVDPFRLDVAEHALALLINWEH